MDTITSVPGIRVGHATHSEGGTGCTVLLGPFRGAVEVGGMATGSRELGVLSAEHLVPQVNAILLTGGSAFGLAAADGVVEWLAEREEGFPTGVRPVPIVPAAVIFDLVPGGPHPDSVLGRMACEAASVSPVDTGRIGAGAGARVGSLLGPDSASPGGIGSVATSMGGYRVGALAVVNAFGDVVGRDGAILAGARGSDGAYLDTARALREQAFQGGFGEAAVQNTTLAVVATDAPLTRIDLARLAKVAGTALPRCISPVNTPFDGDITFALSTAEGQGSLSPGEVLGLGVAARDVLEEAIRAAVGTGH